MEPNLKERNLSVITIIDADVLAYLSCKPRYESKSYKQGDEIVETFKLTHEKPKQNADYTAAEDAKYAEQSWRNFKRFVQTIEEACFSDFSLITVKQGKSFRDDIYDLYKANRTSKNPNNFVHDIRERAIEELGAVPAINREGDDLVRIWSVEATANGDDFIVCSHDKDMDCIPGKHYNPKKNELYIVSELEALKLFYEQLLKGDPTDNIPGLPGIGKVKAAALLEGFNEEYEMQWLVTQQYKLFYGEDWKSYLLSNGKMLYLQKHPDDYFNLDGWAIAEDE